jgi:cell division protein ZipA
MIVFLSVVVAVLVFLLLMQKARWQSHLRHCQSQRIVKKPSERVSYLEPKLESVSSSHEFDVKEATQDVSQEKENAIVFEDAKIKHDNISQELNEVEQEVEAQPVVNEEKQPEDLFISLYIESSLERPYSGYELLQAILSSGLRYGEHSIFHYYADKTSKDKTLFSLASAVKPGTFDLPRMGAFSTRALTLVLDVEKVDEPLKAFEKMLHVAGQLCEYLGGKVLNSDRELLTKECVRDTCLSLNNHLQNKSNYNLFEQLEVTI